MSCKKWALGCGIGCGSVVVLIGVVGLVAWKSTGLGKASSETTETLAKAKALGLPLLATDLQREPPLKESDNAYLILDEAASDLQFDGELQKSLKEFDTTLAQKAPPEEVLQAIGKLKKLPSQAQQFASKPHCDFNNDWDTLPFDMQELDAPNNAEISYFKRLSYVKTFAKILAAKARAEAKQGQLEPALRDLRFARRIGELTRETPLLINNLVAIACDAITAAGYEETIQTYRSDNAKLKRIQAELSAWNQPISLASAIPGEFYFELVMGRNAPNATTMLRQRADMTAFPRPAKLRRSGEPQGLVMRGLITRSLQRWIQIRQELDKKPSDSQMLAYLKGLNKTHSFDYTLANMLIPEQVQEAIMKANAQRRCLRGLVASLSYRKAQGRYPKTLAEAGFKELDPFTDKPLKVIADAYDFKVYSIGPDGVDNQGRKKNEMKGSKTPDQSDVVASCPVR